MKVCGGGLVLAILASGCDNAAAAFSTPVPGPGFAVA
jgi:hypothetical protein